MNRWLYFNKPLKNIKKSTGFWMNYYFHISQWSTHNKNLGLQWEIRATEQKPTNFNWRILEDCNENVDWRNYGPPRGAAAVNRNVPYRNFIEQSTIKSPWFKSTGASYSVRLHRRRLVMFELRGSRNWLDWSRLDNKSSKTCRYQNLILI